MCLPTASRVIILCAAVLVASVAGWATECAAARPPDSRRVMRSRCACSVTAIPHSWSSTLHYAAKAESGERLTCIKARGHGQRYMRSGPKTPDRGPVH